MSLLSLQEQHSKVYDTNPETPCLLLKLKMAQFSYHTHIKHFNLIENQ